jgi:GTP-binding protein
MFIDRARIFVSGGAGGFGCLSFRREKYIPRGGPDGGDGGNGGDVYLVATSRLTSLLDVHYHPHWKGQRGVHGKGKQMHGKNGEHVEIAVPKGTLVKDVESGEVLCDLVEEGQRFLAAKGGKGGRGNARFKSSTHQAPHFAENGEPGESREYWLELKVLAEAGLVGLPNAGKSTLLAAISAAQPKIADYPFTTITPNLGVVAMSGYRTFTVADIPGIIEGAAEGKGLGFDFLRHIERTRVLIFIIDLGDPDPVETLRVLEEELAQHSPEFVDRPRIVALNKADVTENRERFEEIKGMFPRAHLISGVTGEGVPELLETLWQLIERLREAEKHGETLIEEPEREYSFEPPFRVFKEAGGFRVEGKKVQQAVRMTDFHNEDGVFHMQHMLRRMGVFRALKRFGAQEGQSIFIDDLELEYHPD